MFEYLAFYTATTNVGDYLSKYASLGFRLVSCSVVKEGSDIIHYIVMERQVQHDYADTQNIAPAAQHPGPVYLEVTDDKIGLAELQRTFGEAIPLEIGEMLLADWGAFHVRSSN